MKIAIFTYGISRKAGGVFDATRNLFTNKAFKNIIITIYSFYDRYSDLDKPLWNNIPIYLFNGNFALYSSNIKKVLLKINTDIFHMEGLWRYPHIFMGIWKTNRKEPIVCSPHGMLDPYIIKSHGKFKRLLAKLFFKKGLLAVDCWHALCQKELDDIRSYGLKQPIAIIPNGVKLSTNSYLKKDSSNHLLYLGRLHRKKGIDLLLYAIINIMKETPYLLNNWIVDIVGWDDDNYLKYLKKIVSNNHLEKIVIFHGSLYGVEKEKMYAQSEAYILPSHGEGLPLTVLEAWSWKLPVIMTPQCNIPKGYSTNAAIYIEDNTLSVQQGIKELLIMNKKEREIMGMNGYNLVMKEYSWDNSANKMLELYQWLLKKKEKPDFVYL